MARRPRGAGPCTRGRLARGGAALALGASVSARQVDRFGPLPASGSRLSEPGARSPDYVMKILLIMDPLIPVPPLHYGGIERVVADLAERLIERGHAVTL